MWKVTKIMEQNINSRIKTPQNGSRTSTKRSCLIALFVLILFVLFLELIFQISEEKAAALFEMYTNSEVLAIYNLTRINLEKSYKMKYILYWNTFCNMEDMGLGFGQEIFSNCPISTCFTTNNRSLMPGHEFDAIIFEGTSYYADKDPPPKNRSTHQKYIFLRYMLLTKRVPNNFYNWTMTFRKDSDIIYECGSITERLIPNENYTFLTEAQVKSKKKMVAWLKSNCLLKIRNENRQKFVEDLKKFVDVDVFESCGTLRCGEENCMEMLEREYYFHLSFGDAICDYYVSEKLFDNLKYNVVPVVYGNISYYPSTEPYRSVVYVTDFDSVADLSAYLNELAANYTEYIKYFEWKKQYDVSPGRNDVLCQLCEKLHAPLQYSSYRDINEW